MKDKYVKTIKIPVLKAGCTCEVLCPYLQGNPSIITRVGSYACEKCQYHHGFSEIENTASVNCSYIIEKEQIKIKR